MSKCKHKWLYGPIEEKNRFAGRICEKCKLLQQSPLIWSKGFKLPEATGK